MAVKGLYYGLTPGTYTARMKASWFHAGYHTDHLKERIAQKVECALSL